MASEKRCDSEAPCPICREPFGLKPQLLLSCTHVFHEACIAAFERFVRAHKRVCPLCRRRDYQKRGVDAGVRATRAASAVRVQACARGFLARRAYATALSGFYAQGGGGLDRRRAFFASRVGRVGDRLVEAVAQRGDDLDRLFAQFDQSVARSRQVLGAAPGGELYHGGTGRTTATEWEGAEAAAIERACCECPICMGEFTAGGAAPREKVLLSCSHVFHTKCIEAFEGFNVYECHLCPVCRRAYDKMVLED
jgi:hypothetical protein